MAVGGAGETLEGLLGGSIRVWVKDQDVTYPDAWVIIGLTVPDEVTLRVVL